MNGGKLPLGYTIIEVMVVLAVSGVMFVLAANFISGQQGKTAFQQGTNELSSRLQSVVEEVTDGHYTDIPLTCDASGNPVTFAGSASQGQGTNQGCVFLGKLLHFSVGGQPSKYEVFSLAGARSLPGGMPVTSYANSRLAAVYASGPGGVNLTKAATIPQNLEVKSMSVIDTGGTHYDLTYPTIGFSQGLGGADDVSGSYKSGSQTIEMIFDPSINNLNMDFGLAYSLIKAGNIRTARSATICVTDGARYATVILGTNNNQLHLEVNQLGGVAC